jgi:hypothetical protein
MFHRGPLVFRVLVALLVLAVLFAGGAGLYRAGFTRGVTQGARISAQDAPQTQSRLPFRRGLAPMPWGGLQRGMGPGMMGVRGGFFFPFMRLGGFLLFSLLGLAVLFALFRPRPWAHGPMGHHPWAGRPCPYAPEGQPGSAEPESPARPDAPKQEE